MLRNKNLWILASTSACIISIYIIKSQALISQSQSFEKFTDTFFTQEVISSTLTLHYTLKNPQDYGIVSYPVTYDICSQSLSSEDSPLLQTYLDTLHSFCYEDLSDREQLSYDILELSLRNGLEALKYPYYKEPLGCTTGIQAQLPVLLSEYQFFTVEDIETYLQLLSATEEYFSQILEYEKEKSKRGLFMAEKNARTIISQCQDFISPPPEENLLVYMFNERINALSFLTSDERLMYQEENLKLVTTCVLPAYQNLARGLSSLCTSGKNENGLYYFPLGRQYYEHLLRSQAGTYLPVNAIENRIRTQLLKDLQECRTLLAKNPTPDISQPLKGFFDTPEEILADLQTQMADIFPAPPDVSCEINYIPDNLSQYLSPAFYLTPPIDDTKNNVIYLNPAANYTDLDLYTTLAHEGYPGHLYQTVFSSQYMEPFRSLLSAPGFTEGWATYVEMESYKYAYTHLTEREKNTASFARLNRSVMLGISSLLDLYIHDRGFTREDTRIFLKNLGFTNEASADSLFDAILDAPANYLNYYFGYLSFLDLRTYIGQHAPDTFQLKEFHRQILEIGPCPFPVLEKYLKASFF